MKKLSSTNICFLLCNQTGRSLYDILARYGIVLSMYEVADMAIRMHSAGRIALSLSEDDMPPHRLEYALVEPSDAHDPNRYVLIIASKSDGDPYMIPNNDVRLVNLQKEIDAYIAHTLERFAQDKIE